MGWVKNLLLIWTPWGCVLVKKHYAYAFARLSGPFQFRHQTTDLSLWEVFFHLIDILDERISTYLSNTIVVIIITLEFYISRRIFGKMIGTYLTSFKCVTTMYFRRYLTPENFWKDLYPLIAYYAFLIWNSRERILFFGFNIFL